MARYGREQRGRAVDLYVRYERCAADVIRELGHPGCVCSIESGPCERVESLQMSGRF